MHCVAIAAACAEDELICPFSVVGNADSYRVTDFEADTQEEAIKRGWASLDQSRLSREPWIFGREGTRRTEKGVVDMLIVSAWVPGMFDPVTVLQPFARMSDRSLYFLQGPELFVGGRYDSETIEDWDSIALMRGVRSHPRGAQWSMYCPQ